MARELTRKTEQGVTRGGYENDPFREVVGLRDTISGLFDDFFSGRPVMAGFTAALPRIEGYAPPVDVRETDDEIVVYASLPGVPKEHCSLEVRDNTLVLSGRCPETGPDDENWVRREMPCGSFYRAFGLPAEVKADQVKAGFKDGVLEVRIPKAEEAKPRRISIG